MVRWRQPNPFTYWGWVLGLENLGIKWYDLSIKCLYWIKKFNYMEPISQENKPKGKKIYGQIAGGLIVLFCILMLTPLGNIVFNFLEKLFF